MISVITLIAFLIGPDFLMGTSAAEFMLKHRGLMIYHCIVFSLLTGLFRKLHAEITMEIKW